MIRPYHLQQDLRKSILETPFAGAHSCVPLPDMGLVRKSYLS